MGAAVTPDSMNPGDQYTRRRRPLLAALLVVPAAIGLALSPPASAQGGRPDGGVRSTAIIVLDGSNSMNGRLTGASEQKYVTARNALLQALASSTPGTQFGLAAFGSQRTRDCNDAAVLVAPGDGKDEVKEALDDFQPRGWSPVALALRKAAEALPQGRSKKSIVLLLDDLASCRSEDPCEAAEELHDKDPSLTIHVVGLGLKQSEVTTMTCVAEKTGGRLFDSSTPDEAAQSILTAMRLVNAAPPRPEPALRRPPAPKVARAPVPRGLAPPVAVLLPGLNLFANLSPARKDVIEQVTWLVTPAGGSETTPAVASSTSAMLNVKLPVGKYEVQARAGLVTKKIPLDVDSGAAAAPRATPIVLDAAMLSISAPLAAGGSLSSSTLLALYEASTTSGQAAMRPLWMARVGAENLVVPPGTYRIVASDGRVNAERTLSVAAGDHKAVELPLAAGRLSVQMEGKDASAIPEAVRISIEKDDPDSPTGSREIARSATTALDITLPAGAYRVTARDGTAETIQRVVLTAGSLVRRRISLTATDVRLVSRIGQSLPAGLPVAFRIERLDGAPRTITLRGKAEPVVNLVPGRYRIDRESACRMPLPSARRTWLPASLWCWKSVRRPGPTS